LKAVILAGGLGTRLRPLTCNLPKPMVPVLNRPLLQHIIRHLQQHQITELILLLFYLPERIESYFGDGSKFGVNISYITASEEYGTAGAVKLAAHLIDGPFLVFSGDGLTDLDVTRLLEFHRQKAGLGTLALAHVTDPSPFGIVITDKQHRITRFLEKPSWGQVFSDTVNMGIYVLEPQMLEFIPVGKEYYFEKDVYPKLVQESQPLFGFIHNGYWRDIGDAKTYQQAHWDAIEKKMELQIDEPFKHGVWRGKGCKIGKGVKFDGGVILGDHTQVADNVTFFKTVVGENCKIGRGSIIKNSILWSGVEIGQKCELVQDVVGRVVAIENGCILDQNVFISDGSKIGANSRINANVKIWPNKEVDVGSVVNATLVWGDKWQRELFTDSRVTGLANFEISPEFGAKLGAAFGSWIGKGRSVLVSRDATPAARMIYRSVISGILSAGVNVENLQDMAIPIVRYTLHSASEQGGLHVRRSPFDRNLLDLLFFDRNGRDFSPGATKAIERIFYREDFPRVSFDEVGRIDYPVRVAQSYAQDFLEHIDLSAIESAKLKVVIDYSFGSATQIFPSILGSLDCEVISLNAYLDPERLTRSAEEFADALKQLAKIVKSTGANIGFLIDAGAEKVFCVDEKGENISSERLAVLLTRLYLESHRPQKIAVPVSVPSQIETFAREHDTEILYTSDDGGSLMKATEDAAVNFVVDTKGGFIFPEFHFAFDGMYAVVKILEMLAQAKTSLRKLNAQIPKRAFAIAQVPCPWEAKGKVMRRLDEDSQGQRRLLVDGVRIHFEDAWVLVAPDRDKALYHILAEAGNNGTAEKLAAHYQQKLADWIHNG